jgi:ABC-type lipoprotein export system ATPase subunit
MITKSIIFKDDNYSIQLIRDGHVGVIVQLISFIPKLLPNHENVLVEHLSSHVELSFHIKVRIKGLSDDLTVNHNFKQEVANAVSQCEKKLALIQQNHEYIEGTLKDYASISE